MAKAKKPMAHKLWAGSHYSWLNERYTMCNLDLWALKKPAIGRKTWRGVVCKKCLRKKPKRRGV